MSKNRKEWLVGCGSRAVPTAQIGDRHLTKTLFCVGLAITAYVCGFAVPQVQAKTGSYTFHVQGQKAPDGTIIRVTAKAEDGTSYDDEFDVSGNTEEQIRNMILSSLRDKHWIVEENGTNGILIKGTKWSKIKEVDAGDNCEVVEAKGDGDVKVGEAKPGEKKITFSCALPNVDATNPGAIALNLNEIVVLAPLTPGDTPTDAASKLETALTEAGLMVTRDGAVITLDWENLTNSSLLGDSLHIDLGLADGAGGPHLTLGMPDVGILPTVSEWGLIVMTLFLLIAGTIVIVRRRLRIAA